VPSVIPTVAKLCTHRISPSKFWTIRVICIRLLVTTRHFDLSSPPNVQVEEKYLQPIFSAGLGGLMKLRSRMVTLGLLLAGNLLSARADADPYPPVGQKRH